MTKLKVATIPAPITTKASSSTESASKLRAILSSIAALGLTKQNKIPRFAPGPTKSATLYVGYQEAAKIAIPAHFNIVVIAIILQKG